MVPWVARRSRMAHTLAAVGLLCALLFLCVGALADAPTISNVYPTNLATLPVTPYFVYAGAHVQDVDQDLDTSVDGYTPTAIHCTITPDGGEAFTPTFGYSWGNQTNGYTYEWYWQPTADGVYTIEFTAADQLGAHADPVSVEITITNAAPDIVLSPPWTTPCTTGNPVCFDATVSDANGNLGDAITFTVTPPNGAPTPEMYGPYLYGDASVKTALGFFYPSVPGSYTLHCTAEDSFGAQADDATRTITVENPAPTVSVSLETAGEPGFITQMHWAFHVEAQDSNGTVQQVRYRVQPAADPAPTTSTQYLIADGLTLDLPLVGGSIDWLVPAGPASYHVYVIAQDNDGAWSEPAVQAFQTYNQAPEITIEEPLPDTTWSTHLQWFLRAQVTDPNGTIIPETVRWRWAPANNQPVDPTDQNITTAFQAMGFDEELQQYRVLCPPFSTIGDDILYVVAKDDEGTWKMTSMPITVNNTPPGINITIPDTSITMQPNQDFTFSGTCWDQSLITRIELRTDNGTVIGHGLPNEDGTWAITWPADQVTTGIYTISAYAKDDDGDWGCSLPVTVKVVKVTFEPATVCIAQNGTATVTPTVLPDGLEVTYTSDAPGTATISADGKTVTGVNGGVTTVEARVDGVTVGALPVMVAHVDLSLNNLSEQDEENIGGILSTNAHDPTPVMIATSPIALTGGTVTLSASPGLHVWENANRTGLLIPGTQGQTSVSWEIGQDILPNTVFVDGITPSQTLHDTSLTCIYTNQAVPGNHIVTTDTINFTVIAVHLSFTPTSRLIAGSMGIGTVTITGLTAQNQEDGIISITGESETTSIYVPDEIALLPGGGDIHINMPSSTGTFYYTAYITAHLNPDRSNHANDTIISSNCCEVSLYTAHILVRAKKTQNPDIFSTHASICAGGIGSNAHIAEVKITIDPPTAGVTGYPRVIGGWGYSKPASLSISQQSDANGIIVGELVSSDTIEDITIFVADSTAIVSSDWDIDWPSNPSPWQSNPLEIAQSSTETIQFTHHGEPMNGHQIKFNIGELTYTDQQDNVLTINEPDILLDYAYFNPIQTLTDTLQGKATTSLTTRLDLLPGLSEELLFAEDNTVYEPTTDGIEDGSPTSKPNTPIFLIKYDKQYEFRPGPMPVFLTVGTTTTSVAKGTNPYNNAKVFPGQQLLFQVEIQDVDECREVGTMNWKPFNNIPGYTEGNYHVSIQLENAHFTDGDNIDEFVPLRKGSIFGIRNIPIIINNGLPPGSRITVDIYIIDQVTLYGGIQLAPGNTINSCQDGLNGHVNMELVWTVINTSSLPTMTVIQSQSPGIISSAQPCLPGINVWNKCLPDRNGLTDTTPNYNEVTVLETYSPETSNITKWNIDAAYRMQHPTWDNIEWTAFLVSSATKNHSTFVVNYDDIFSDSHSQNIPGIEYLVSGIFNTNNIYIDFHQRYECPPGTIIGQYTIRRRRDGTATPITNTIKKY